MSALSSTPTPSEAGTASKPHAAIARATLARFIAALFCEPDQQWCQTLADPVVSREVEYAVTVLDLACEPAAARVEMILLIDAIADDHGRLFGHTARSACPPYELEYGRNEIFQQSQSMADIAGFYAAFGFELRSGPADRPDHIVVQWELLAMLALKEARAAFEDRAAAQVCVEAQRSFLKSHAAAWMPAFFNRVRQIEATGFYRRAADLAEAVLREWCGWLQVPFGPKWLEIRPVTEEDSSITCGVPGESAVELGPRLAAAMDSAAHAEVSS